MVDDKSNDKPGLSNYSQTGSTFTQPTPAVKPAENPSAIIGPKIRIKGELMGEEDLLIQGQVEGTIDLKENNLTIGKEGILKANASARIITIEGDVEGDLFGQERIVILKSSNVRGNIVADRVSLEDGAKFRGSIDMDVNAKSPDLLKPKFAEFAQASAASPLPRGTEAYNKNASGSSSTDGEGDKNTVEKSSAISEKDKNVPRLGEPSPKSKAKVSV